MDAFEAQKSYFQIQIDRCEKKPDLHKNKIEDCKHYLKALEDAGSNAEFKKYVQSTGNMISTAKAEAKDRYENYARIFEKLGQLKKVEAEKLRLQEIDGSNTHQELTEKLEAIEEKSSALHFEENKAISAVCSILRACFNLATDPKGSKAEELSITNLREYKKIMKEGDPEMSWEKITSYKPYRDRIVFTEEQLAVIKANFEEA
ncbi:hypothetical protein ACFL20_04485 [Spirochaetota bacterium]